MKQRKLCSLTLVFIMLVMLILWEVPVQVSAVETADYIITNNLTNYDVNGSGGYATLQAALLACTTDLDSDGKLLIQFGNGSALSVNAIANASHCYLPSAYYTGSVNFTGIVGGYQNGLEIQNSENVIFQALTMNNDPVNMAFTALKVNTGATLTVENGTSLANSFSAASTSYVIVNDGTLNINGGTIGGDVNTRTAIINNAGGTMEVTGGTIRSLAPAAQLGTGVVNNGSITVSGSAYITGTQYGVDNESSSTSTSTTVNGGIVEATGAGGVAILTRASAITVTGGIVRATNSGHAIYYSPTGGSTGGVITVSGGTVSSAGTNPGDAAIFLGQNGTTAISGTATVTGAKNGIYFKSGAAVNNNLTISGGTVESTDATDASNANAGAAINVTSGPVSTVTVTGGTIKSVNQNTLKLTKNTASDIAKFIVYGTSVYCHNAADIKITGVQNPSDGNKYEISSINSGSAIVTASNITGGFLKWTKDSLRAISISTINGDSLNNLSAGANTDVYLKIEAADYVITNNAAKFDVNGSGAYGSLSAALAACTTDLNGDGKLMIQFGSGSVLSVPAIANASHCYLQSAYYSGSVNFTGIASGNQKGFEIPNASNAVFQNLSVTNSSANVTFNEITVNTGGNLTVESGTSISVSFGVASAAYVITNNGTLNINGGIIQGDSNTRTAILNNAGGVITANGGVVQSVAPVEQYGTGVYNLGSITVSGSAQITAAAYGIDAEGHSTNTINGGIVEATGNDGKAIMTRGADITVTGGIVRSTNSSGGRAIYYTQYASTTGAAITISGGTVSGASTSFYDSAIGLGKDGTTVISGTATIIGAKNGINYEWGTSVTNNITISGGTIESADATSADADPNAGAAINMTSGSKSTINITGGTIKSVNQNTLKLEKNTAADIAKFTVYGTNIYCHDEANIRITGVQNAGDGNKYEITGANSSNAVVKASNITGGKDFLNWTSDSVRANAISTLNGDTLAHLSAGSNTDVYLNTIVPSPLASFTPITLTQTGDVANHNVQYGNAAAVIAAFPTAVSVTLVNSSVVNVPITWTDTDNYNAGTAGNYTFTATWGAMPTGANNNNSLPAPTVEVTVMAGILPTSSLASFTPVTLTQTGDVANHNVQYGNAAAVIAALPTTVSVTLVNSSVVNVPVTWTDTDSYNAGTAGNYTFTATWGAMPTGANNNNSLPAPTVEVTVVAGILPTSPLASFIPVTLTQTGDVANHNVQYETAAAVIAALPTTVSVTLVDSSVVSVPITWTDTDHYNAGAAGNYTFTATWGVMPSGANNNNILAAPAVEVTVAAGTPPAPPAPPTTPATPTTPTTPTTPKTPTSSGVDIIVNKDVVNAGIASDSKEGGKTVTTITVDQQKLDQKLAAEGNNALVIIPINTKSDKFVGQLNGQMIKAMEDKQATLEVRTGSATYTLPASEVNIDAVSAKLGTNVTLSDITVQVTIATPSDQKVTVVKSAAEDGGFTVKAPAVDFNISCTYNGKTVDVSTFNTYIERTVAIPDGVDPAKITTGVVVEPDGTVRHVPTKVTIINGKYYAVINSLTNSTYAVIWHPIEFKDVAKHWDKEEINDMGSRMVIHGVGNELFEPDRDITRAEFAAIVVRGLGLKPGTGNNPFADVKATEWYKEYIETAYQYGIIAGYGNGKFGPMDKITREQAISMISRAMKITGLKVELKPTDIELLLKNYSDSKQVAGYAQSTIAGCIKTGIFVGRSGKIAPKEYITRAEVAVMVRRLLQKSDLI